MKLLFLCPHGAAKSVVAAALVQEATSDAGMTVDVSNAGTDPDPDLNPIVVGYLTEASMPLPGPPRDVQPADIATADIVVNIGCDLAGLPTPDTLIEWEIPDFSDDPEAAFAALHAQTSELVEQLRTQIV